MRPDPTFDPGASLCGHANRIHYLGGGIFVCFECLLRHLPTPARPSHGKRGNR